MLIRHPVQMLLIPLAGGMLNFTVRAMALNVSPYKRNCTFIQEYFRTINARAPPSPTETESSFLQDLQTTCVH